MSTAHQTQPTTAEVMSVIQEEFGLFVDIDAVLDGVKAGDERSEIVLGKMIEDAHRTIAMRKLSKPLLDRLFAGEVVSPPAARVIELPHEPGAYALDIEKTGRYEIYRGRIGLSDPLVVRGPDSGGPNRAARRAAASKRKGGAA